MGVDRTLWVPRSRYPAFAGPRVPLGAVEKPRGVAVLDLQTCQGSARTCACVWWWWRTQGHFGEAGSYAGYTSRGLLVARAFGAFNHQQHVQQLAFLCFPGFTDVWIWLASSTDRLPVRCMIMPDNKHPVRAVRHRGAPPLVRQGVTHDNELICEVREVFT